MGKLLVIHCEDCGAPRMTRYTNTKYCEICRLARNLKFVGDRTQKCLVDQCVFAPVKRGQELSLTCDTYSTPGGMEGTCGLCETEEARLYGEHIRVCTKCLDDPKRRPEIYGMLLLKQKLIREGEIEIPEPEIPVVKTEAHDDEAATTTI